MAVLSWAFSESWIPKMLNAGLSKNAIQSRLRDMGWKGRRARLFSQIDMIKGVPISKKALKSMPKFLAPDPWMIRPTSQKLSQKYLYRFDVTAKNIFTGKTEKLYRSMYRDDLLSRSELEGQMAEHMTEIDPSKEWEVDKVEILSVTDRDKELF